MPTIGITAAPVAVALVVRVDVLAAEEDPVMLLAPEELVALVLVTLVRVELPVRLPTAVEVRDVDEVTLL